MTYNTALKCDIQKQDKNTLAPKELYFFSDPRQDSLKYLKLESDRIMLHYRKRTDFCFYQEFEFKAADQVLKKIVEKFNRNLFIPADKDIAVRTFNLNERKISLKYHYAKGALTASTREFIKPQKPDYGQQIMFDSSLIKSYKPRVSESPILTRARTRNIHVPGPIDDSSDSPFTSRHRIAKSPLAAQVRDSNLQSSSQTVEPTVNMGNENDTNSLTSGSQPIPSSSGNDLNVLTSRLERVLTLNHNAFMGFG
ncbi:Coiled-coil domain-containing protein lobo [Lucilia cuprina]|uniref:Coiled-coil domain-containing protein lobo n=1 Tax=Lucilia cuprina TaxID=7375 RepID=A0A0L0C9Y6_LUCCU|nr:Coiled-coil domain-containing protein lobo [Lucilia cuprina]